jgi:hypothetical protein
MFSREINRHEGTLYGIIETSTINEHKCIETQRNFSYWTRHGSVSMMLHRSKTVDAISCGPRGGILRYEHTNR